MMTTIVEHMHHGNAHLLPLIKRFIMSTSSECMLSTKDNPYDPFEDFESWFAYDTRMGYGSCSFLARVANTSSELSDEENNLERERAMTEIIANDPTQMFIRVERGKFKPPETK